MMMKMTKYKNDYNFEKKNSHHIYSNVINIAEGNSDQILQIFYPIIFLALIVMSLLLKYKLSSLSQV